MDNYTPIPVLRAGASPGIALYLKAAPPAPGAPSMATHGGEK